MIAEGLLSIRTVGDLAEKIQNGNKKNGGQRKRRSSKKRPITIRTKRD